MTKRKGYAAVNEAFDAAKKGNTLLRKMIKESADMADTEARCEPPPELRERDGWHWVQFDPWPPRFAEWHASPYGGRQPLWRDYERQRSCTPEWAAKEWGWRYIASVATPVEVDALRAERDALRQEQAAYHEHGHRMTAEATELNADVVRIATERDTLRATVAGLVEALEALVSEFGCTIEQYHKNGPDWTHKDGTEVFEVRAVLDREPLIEAARAALSAARGGEKG